MSPLPSRIRELNDQLRRYFASQPWLVEGPFQVLLTPGLKALDQAGLTGLVRKVESFDDFTSDNDPHQEYDFGAIDHDGVRYFWKIDYYSLDFEEASPDPTDPLVTTRVLTIMRADEY